MAKAVVSLLDGLNLKDPKAQIHLTHDSEYLIIEEKKAKLFGMATVDTYRIPLPNILDTTITNDDEILEKDRSVIGRGIVGGVLFGPAGLVLGGMSGIGRKKSVKKTLHVYIVSYVSSDGEIKNITFTMPFMMISVTSKFDKELKKRLGLVIKSDKANQILAELAEKDKPRNIIL